MITPQDLEYLFKDGIISKEQLQAQIEMSKRQELLDKHPHKTWEKNGYYYTYLVDESRPNNRRQIKRKDKKGLEDEIIKNVKETEAITFKDVFDDYVYHKTVVNDDIKDATVSRYKEAFDRHYVATGWDKKDVRKVSQYDYVDFLEHEISRCKLNSKAFGNLRVITKGMIKRANRRGLLKYTYSTVFEMIDKQTYKKKKNTEEQRLSKEELAMFVNYLTEHPTIHHLALLLMVVTGIRIGEMVTLAFDDFIDNTTFVVHKTETRYKGENGYIYEIKDAPKTDAGERVVVIPRDYSWIVRDMKKLRPFATYLCTNDKGERMTTNALRSRQYRVCDELAFKYKKSPHKLRKTFASILRAEGCDEQFIISQLGHTDIGTTDNFYNFDRGTLEEKHKAIDNIVELKAVSNN